MKYSKQRELVENAVKDNPIHPTADDIYSILKASNPTISLGTVYRNLNLLADLGIVNKISMASSSDRYDGNTTEHYHALCEQCNIIYDIDLDILSLLEQTVEEKIGFSVTKHYLMINGICQNCKN